MNYAIGEFAEITGISIYTLRYYEKEKLLAPQRLPNGRRYYTALDMVWVQFIKRLKETGMPIKEIQRYAILRAKGDATLNARLELLVRHRKELKEKLATMQDALDKLDKKIRYYKTEIKKV